MPQPFKEWTVLPHGKLTRLDENLLSVVGELHMPLGNFPRRMTVVRLRDGRLVIYSAMALDEAEMRALEDYGAPSYMIVPGDIHRLDARVWKDRYPAMKVVTPEGSRAKVEEVVAVDASEVDFEDPSVRYVTVPGTDGHEAALVIESYQGATVVVNDLIWNLADRPGFGGWVFRLAGFTGPEPRIPTLIELSGIKDKDALRAQLDAWAALPGLQRLIVSHGEIVTKDPAGVLRALSASLAA